MSDSEEEPAGRKRRVRLSPSPITKSVRDLRKKRDSDIKNILPYFRPEDWNDCQVMPRPCPYVGCKYHLYLDVTDTGSIKFNFPGISPLEIAETCSLDVANRGESTLDEVGNLMNLSRERIRQIETRVLKKLEKVMKKS